jgi:hypothetical protein
MNRNVVAGICLCFICLPAFSSSMKAQPADSLASHVLDVSVAFGPSLGPTVQNYARFLQSLGYASPSSTLNDMVEAYGVVAFASVQYFIQPRFALGVAAATMGDFAGNPAKILSSYYYREGNSYHIREGHKSYGLYATASYLIWAPVLDRLHATVKLTSGLGMNRFTAEHDVWIYKYVPSTKLNQFSEDKWQQNGSAFSALFAAAVEARVSAYFSLGVNLSYRYVPHASFDAHSFPIKVDGVIVDTFSLPASDPNFSDWNIGLCMTLHLL